VALVQVAGKTNAAKPQRNLINQVGRGRHLRDKWEILRGSI